MVLVEKSTDFQTGGGFSGANELQHSFIVQYGLTGPVIADEGKHSVFNGISFGGAGRIMTDLDFKAEATAKGELQLMLPQACSVAIASAAICKDKQAIGIEEVVGGKDDLAPLDSKKAQNNL
jgi:hypothetical protein